MKTNEVQINEVQNNPSTIPFSNYMVKPRIEMHNATVVNNRLVGTVLDYPMNHAIPYSGIRPGVDNQITTSNIVKTTEVPSEGVTLVETTRSVYIVKSWFKPEEQPKS